MRIKKGNLSDAISRKSSKKSGCNGATEASVPKLLSSDTIRLNQLNHVVKILGHNMYVSTYNPG
jgi:hypothetical protein